MPNVLSVEILLVQVGNLTGQDLEFALWVNDFTPLPESVFSDFVEAGFPGYERITVTADQWPDPVYAGVSLGVVATLPTAIEWAATADSDPPSLGNVYGVVAVDLAGNWILAQRFEGGPYQMIFDGQTLFFIPRFGQRSIPSI